MPIEKPVQKLCQKGRFSITVPLGVSAKDAVPLPVTVAKIIHCDYTRFRLLIYTPSNLQVARNWVVHMVKNCVVSNNSSDEGTVSVFNVKPISYDVLCVAAHVCKRRKWLYLYGNKVEKYVHFTCKYASGVVRSFA